MEIKYAIKKIGPLRGGRMGASRERAERIKAVRLVLNSVAAAAAVAAVAVN